MDKRENVEQNLYQKELQEEAGSFNEYVEENGNKFRMPYKMVKEVIFNNIRKEELIDIEHSARLQYRLLLNDAILRAKVEFVKQRITLTYSPMGSETSKPKISIEGIADTLAAEGVHLDFGSMTERDVDYYKEIYGYQFNPPSIREHAPYGYTLDEWRKMKPEYEKKKAEYERGKLKKFEEFQEGYVQEHPELAKQGKTEKPQKKPLLGIFGKKKKNDEKGFGSTESSYILLSKPTM